MNKKEKREIIKIVNKKFQVDIGIAVAFAMMLVLIFSSIYTSVEINKLKANNRLNEYHTECTKSIEIEDYTTIDPRTENVWDITECIEEHKEVVYNSSAIKMTKTGTRLKPECRSQKPFILSWNKTVCTKVGLFKNVPI